MTQYVVHYLLKDQMSIDQVMVGPFVDFEAAYDYLCENVPVALDCEYRYVKELTEPKAVDGTRSNISATA